jgi:hypothetical protein
MTIHNPVKAPPVRALEVREARLTGQIRDSTGSDEALNPRETLRRLPAIAQCPLTALIGKPLQGQRAWNRPPLFHVLSAAAWLLCGSALSWIAAARGGLSLMLLIPGWMFAIHAMRNMRTMLLHQASHTNLFGHRRLDAAVGTVISSLLVVESFRGYRRGHIADHHSAHHMTLLDPTVKALLGIFRFRAGMPRATQWHKLLRNLVSPWFHVRFLGARLGSQFGEGSNSQRALTVLLYGSLAALATRPGAALPIVLAWIFPVTVLFQITSTLRLSVKHCFPAPGGPRRGKEHFSRLTYAIFLGDPAPDRHLPPLRRAGGWLRWGVRMAFVHFPSRFLVLTGDTVCHDYHHRRPAARDWCNYIFARNDDARAGHSGWPPYREVWTLRGAINLVFDSLQAADPAEFDIRKLDRSTDRERFAAFDD